MIYDGWVYVAKSDTGHYKIGRSRTPVDRIKHFDTIMPVEVSIIAIIPCEDHREAEIKLHQMYSQYRVKGEWFSIPDNYISYLVDCLCYVNGDFIVSLGKNLIGTGHVNTCCVEFHDQMEKHNHAEQQ